LATSPRFLQEFLSWEALPTMVGLLAVYVPIVCAMDSFLFESTCYLYGMTTGLPGAFNGAVTKASLADRPLSPVPTAVETGFAYARKCATVPGVMLWMKATVCVEPTARAVVEMDAGMQPISKAGVTSVRRIQIWPVAAPLTGTEAT